MDFEGSETDLPHDDTTPEPAPAQASAQAETTTDNPNEIIRAGGEHGMTLLSPDGHAELQAEAREVSDVTGAGDTVIATMTLALAAGSPLVDAARLANRAAGVVVGKFGPSTVTIDELRTGER